MNKNKINIKDFPILGKPTSTQSFNNEYKNKLSLNINAVKESPNSNSVTTELPQSHIDNTEELMWQDKMKKLNSYIAYQQQNEIERVGEEAYYTKHPPYVNMFDDPAYDTDIDTDDIEADDEFDDIDSDFD